jgi:hypothetical protein
MKTTIKFYLLLVTTFALVSCANFLDEDPKGKQVIETFYNTDSEVLGGVMGIYSSIINGYTGPNYLPLSEACSDLFTYKPIAAVTAVVYPKYSLTVIIII